jgi:hypothetical protein
MMRGGELGGGTVGMMGGVMRTAVMTSWWTRATKVGQSRGVILAFALTLLMLWGIEMAAGDCGCEWWGVGGAKDGPGVFGDF